MLIGATWPLCLLSFLLFTFTFTAFDAESLIRPVSFWVPILLMCLPNSFLFLQIRGICIKMIHGGSSTCLFFQPWDRRFHMFLSLFLTHSILVMRMLFILI